MKNKIVLYSTHCPMCMMLEKQLKLKNVVYEEVNDIDKMKELGIKSLPVLSVDNKLLNVKEALTFINNL